MFRLIGSISLFPYDFDPNGWVSCDGRTISVYENEQLASLLENTFGGDSEQSGVPNLKAPEGCRYCISLFGAYPQVRYEGLLGETVIWAVHKIKPPNLVECNGPSLPENRNMYLKQLIGGRFGPAEAGKFKLPDLRDRYPTDCLYMMTVDGTDPVGNTQREPFVGEIVLLPYEVHEAAKQTWRLCDGGQFAVSEEPALAHLLGKRFGGDGRLPDLRAAAPRNLNYYISLKGVLPTRG